MTYNKKTIEDISVKGKKVIARCDFNVPMKDGVIKDNEMIAYLSGGKKFTHTSFLEINVVSDVLKYAENDEYILPNKNRYL